MSGARFEGAIPPSLQAFDTEGLVVTQGVLPGVALDREVVGEAFARRRLDS